MWLNVVLVSENSESHFYLEWEWRHLRTTQPYSGVTAISSWGFSRLLNFDILSPFAFSLLNIKIFNTHVEQEILLGYLVLVKKL